MAIILKADPSHSTWQGREAVRTRIHWRECQSEQQFWKQGLSFITRRRRSLHISWVSSFPSRPRPQTLTRRRSKRLGWADSDASFITAPPDLRPIHVSWEGEMGDNCGIVTNDILRCTASEQTALSSVTSDQARPVGHCPLPFRRMASSQDAPAALAFTLNKTSRLGLCCSLYVKCNFSPFPRHPFFDICPRSHSLNTFLTPRDHPGVWTVSLFFPKRLSCAYLCCSICGVLL